MIKKLMKFTLFFKKNIQILTIFEFCQKSYFLIFCKFVKSKNIIFGKIKKRRNFNFFLKKV